jgi:hypothetical protein
MLINRRAWLEVVPALSLAAASTSALAAPAPSGRRVIHHVFFWLKHPEQAGDREKLIAGLKRLRDIPVIRELHVSVPADTEQRSVVDATYHVSELMFFDTVEDQKSYQDHPIHKAFVAECEGLWDRVKVYDSIDV